MTINNRDPRSTNHEPRQKTGKLSVCPTPIGNLGDITLRVLELLKQADLILAEDTRETLKLVRHYGIEAPVKSYYRETERLKLDWVLAELSSGKRLALVSDRGMPGLSDPGHELILACLKKGFEFEILPGPSSILTALVGSGFPAGRFLFLGFLPKKKQEKNKILETVKTEPGTLIFFESPFRLAKSLSDLAEILGDRECVVARELTKKFEEYRRGRLIGLSLEYGGHKPKGEIVLLVKGFEKADREFSQSELELLLRKKTEAGLSKKEAVKEVAAETGNRKKDIYLIAERLFTGH